MQKNTKKPNNNNQLNVKRKERNRQKSKDLVFVRLDVDDFVVYIPYLVNQILWLNHTNIGEGPEKVVG